MSVKIAGGFDYLVWPGGLAGMLDTALILCSVSAFD